MDVIILIWLEYDSTAPLKLPKIDSILFYLYLNYININIDA